jgi:hypothetical protein
MHPDAPYFIILLCPMPDDFTCQGESAATQWVNDKILIIPTILTYTVLYLVGNRIAKAFFNPWWY